MRSKLLCVILATIMLVLSGTVIPVSAEMVNGTNTTSRLAGQDHNQTSVAIAGAYNNGECGNVILASGNSFSDALSASLFSMLLTVPVMFGHGDIIMGGNSVIIRSKITQLFLFKFLI